MTVSNDFIGRGATPLPMGPYGPEYLTGELLDLQFNMSVTARCGHEMVNYIVPAPPRYFQLVEERADVSRQLRHVTRTPCLNRAAVAFPLSPALDDVLALWGRRLRRSPPPPDNELTAYVGEDPSNPVRHNTMFGAAKTGIAIWIGAPSETFHACIWPTSGGWARYAETELLNAKRQWIPQPGRLFKPYVSLPTALRTLRLNAGTVTEVYGRVATCGQLRS